MIRLLASAATAEELAKAPPSFGKRLSVATSILLPVASFADAHRLSVILAAAGQPLAAAQFLKAATPDRIHDSVDAGIALSRGKDEFPGLYSALLTFFEKESAALGRRRFVKAAMKFGSPAQQLEVADQTAAWIEREGFSSEEMRALFNLGAAASDLEVPTRIAPLIRPYLESDSISLEVVIGLVQLMKRIKDAELREFVVLRVVKILESSAHWTLEQTRLARQLSTHPDKEKLASNKLLQSILAEKVGDARAREIFAAIAGTYDMRLGDAHPTSSKIGEALKLAGIDTTTSYLRQGKQLIHNFGHAVWCIGSLLFGGHEESAG